MEVASAPPQNAHGQLPKHDHTPPHQTQGLPSISALTSSLSPPPPQQSSPNPILQRLSEARDSNRISLQSKHSSTMSNPTGLQIQTILNSEDPANKPADPQTPASSRLSGPQFPQRLSNGPMPSLNRGFDQNRNSTADSHRLSGYDGERSSGTDFRSSGISGVSTDYRSSGISVDYRSSGTDYTSYLDSRRSSVDSRMNTGMSHLALNGPASPYESNNVSQVSLASNLQHQRGMQNSSAPAPPRSVGPIPASPVSSRIPGRPSQPRVAPVINPNPRGVSGAPDPTAAAPTKGYAWAFPDHPDDDDHDGDTASGHHMSRQSSFAASSLAGSMYHSDAPLPPGQRRLEEGMEITVAPKADRLLGFSADNPPTTHHHTMKNKTITQLQNAEQGSPLGGGNYSRTPELRNSHKLAERKRRSEMKDLFDTLNEILPGGPTNKTSKWEILSKAIDHIKSQDRTMQHSQSEVARLRPEMEYSRRAQEENELLRNEVAAMYQRLRQYDPANPHVYGQMSSHLAQQSVSTPGSSQAGQPNVPSAPATVLPPLQGQPPSSQQSAPGQAWSTQPPSSHMQASPAPPAASGAMQGVEMYGRR